MVFSSVNQNQSDSIRNVILGIVLGKSAISPHVMAPSKSNREFNKIHAKSLLNAGLCYGRKSTDACFDFLTLLKLLAKTCQAGAKMAVDGKVMAVIIGGTFHRIPHRPGITRHGG